MCRKLLTGNWVYSVQHSPPLFSLSRLSISVPPPHSWTRPDSLVSIAALCNPFHEIYMGPPLRWKNRERKEGGRVLHAVYSVTCGEFPTRNIILPYNSNYAAHRLIKWYWNNSVMSLKRYKSKYMRQNVLNYTFFFKRILEAMRKLYISLLVVESKFGCKNKKV